MVLEVERNEEKISSFIEDRPGRNKGSKTGNRSFKRADLSTLPKRRKDINDLKLAMMSKWTHNQIHGPMMTGGKTQTHNHLNFEKSCKESNILISSLIFTSVKQ